MTHSRHEIIILAVKVVPFPVRRIYIETQNTFLPEFQEYVNEILREIDSEVAPE